MTDETAEVLNRLGHKVPVNKPNRLVILFPHVETWHIEKAPISGVNAE